MIYFDSITIFPYKLLNKLFSTLKIIMDSYANLIRKALNPITWLCITDVTDGHAVEGALDGRALSADGLETLILVVSIQFEKKTLLQRQRMVNHVLAEDLTSGALHSVRMICLTPNQWEKRGRPTSLRPGAPCSLQFQASTLPSLQQRSTDDEQRVGEKRPSPFFNSAVKSKYTATPPPMCDGSCSGFRHGPLVA